MKVSSEEDYDFLQFYIDGQLQHQISGEVAWQQKSYDISGQGSHTLKWVYVKDGSDYEGDDCGRLDYVLWTGLPDPTPDPPPDPTKWKTIDYTYDPAGRRIKKTIDDDYSLKYIYDGGNVIAEYDHDNFLLRKYIYGPGVDEPICMIDVVDSNSVYYYHYDGLGSVVALSDSAGDTVQTYEYSIYGQVAASDPNFLDNPYMFTGRRFDIETGLYYYRARYYNPHIGRFMQTDPVGYGDGINWYAYCRNNPLSFLDPSGYASISISIPLGTVWENASSDEYLLAHPEHSHKIDFDAYLIDAGFYGLYPDVTLTSVEYSDGQYDCVFDFPDELDISMNMVEIVGISVLNVTHSEYGHTPLIDSRLAGMIADKIDPEVVYTHTWGEALPEVVGAYSQACYGVVNAILGGLFDRESGIPYLVSSTVREWSEGDAFQSGETGWRRAEGPILIAGGLKYAKFRGPEYGAWKHRGVWKEGWHFHMGKHPSLQQHHLPQEFVNWWKNFWNLF